jgi:hypothetical protein
MGIRFDLGSGNVVAYLTSRHAGCIRLTPDAVMGFLYRIIDNSDVARPRLISSSPQWIIELRNRAKRSLELANQQHIWDYQSGVPAEILNQVLDPVAEVLGQFDIYVLPVGTWRDADVLDRFALEAANLPGHGILVLIPDFYDTEKNIHVLDPAAGTVDALKNRDAWPGAIFMLREGDSTFLPIEEARSSLSQLMEVLSDDNASAGSALFRDRARQVFNEAQQRVQPRARRKILHLSDLHLGTDRTDLTQMALVASLSRHIDTMDHVVITGDLFDQPRRRHAQLFRNFRHYLQLSGGKKPIVVPGNHDQRLFGNSLWKLGRSYAELAGLDWNPLVVEDVSELVLYCFDSSKSGDLARGRIDNPQLLQMAAISDVENARGRFDGYLKIALLHHHPYPYVPEKEVPIIDPRGWVGREEFIELRGASQFRTWCAGRGVGLILHGHKHIPRLITDMVPFGDPTRPDFREITTVGCGSSLGANGAAMSYNVVEWKPESQSWSVDFQIDRGDGQGFRSAAIESNGIPSY